MHGTREALGRESLGEIGLDGLDDDFSSERGLGREEDPRHPAATDLAFDSVAAVKRRLQRVSGFGHRLPAAGNGNPYGAGGYVTLQTSALPLEFASFFVTESRRRATLGCCAAGRRVRSVAAVDSNAGRP